MAQYNLNDMGTQAALDLVPNIAEQKAQEYLIKQWAEMDFPSESACPYKPYSKPTSIVVAVRGGKLVGWTCVVRFSHGIDVRVKWINQKIECTEKPHMMCSFITEVQHLGTSRLLVRWNNKWKNHS